MWQVFELKQAEVRSHSNDFPGNGGRPGVPGECLEWIRDGKGQRRSLVRHPIGQHGGISPAEGRRWSYRLV